MITPLQIQQLLIRALLLFPLILFAKEPICVFTPPGDFLVQPPDKYPPFIQIAFSGTLEKNYQPTINLAIEKNAGSEDEFLECVNKLQKKKARSKWKKVETIQTKGGVATLFEDEHYSNAGEVKVYQTILVKDDIAYLLTGCTLKKDTGKYLPLFKKSFQSLTLTEDLLSLIEDNGKKKFLQNEAKKVNKKTFNHFQEQVKKNYTSLGSYWQILYLKIALEQVNTKP